jgi:uncharacterized RDD family membrane protein YckC
MTPRDVPFPVISALVRTLVVLLSLATPSWAQDTAAPPEPPESASQTADASTTPLAMPASGGGGEHGWFALPGQSGLTFPALYHLPPAAEPGTVRGGPRLMDFPEAIASWSDRVVLVMPRERVDPAQTRGAEGDRPEVAGRNDPPARLIRRVQSLRVARSPAGSMWEYLPRGREPIAMPSLPGRGELRGLAMHHDALFALIQGAPADAVEVGFDGPRRDVLLLLVEGAREWVAKPMPSEWSPEQPASIVLVNEHVIVIQGSRSWRADANELASGEPMWLDAGLAAPDHGETLASSGSSLVAARAEPERIVVELIREGVRIPLAVVEHQIEQFAIVGGAEAITVIWRGEGDAARLHATVISAISGDVLFDDYARTNAVVSGREIQSLALLVGALMLTILVFVLRPEEALGGAVVMPDGFALAAPMRRVVAVLLDLLPMLTLCAYAFGVSAGAMVEAAALSDESTTRAAAALGIGFLLTGVHSTLGEWLFGRTLGKAIVRCRTVTVRGERPRLWQAALRNFVKLLFPPFALFLFLDLRRRHPGDLVAGTAVLQRHGARDLPGSDDTPSS